MTRPGRLKPSHAPGDGHGMGESQQSAPPVATSPLAPPWYRFVVDYGTDLFTKFANDCTMNLVSMVSYNVLTSFVSLLLGVIVVLALIPGISNDVHGFAHEINRILPAAVQQDANVEGIINLINSASTVLVVIIVIGLLWGGSNLFTSIEGAFAFVYRVKTRDILPQKLLSVLMILLFVVLLPLSFVSSLLLGTATTTLGRIMPAALNGRVSAGLGLAAGLFSLFLLFVAIYIIMPNRPVAWRHAWRGALVAALTMWVVNTVFPFYAAHFIGLRNYGAATIGTVIITITWVWLFSLVLLLGAQINALSMGIAPWRFDLTRILMDQPGPFLPIKHHRKPRGWYTPLPFSGLVRDAHKVQPDRDQRRSDGSEATGSKH